MFLVLLSVLIFFSPWNSFGRDLLAYRRKKLKCKITNCNCLNVHISRKCQLLYVTVFAPFFYFGNWYSGSKFVLLTLAVPSLVADAPSYEIVLGDAVKIHLLVRKIMGNV